MVPLRLPDATKTVVRRQRHKQYSLKAGEFKLPEPLRRIANSRNAEEEDEKEEEEERWFMKEEQRGSSALRRFA